METQQSTPPPELSGEQLRAELQHVEQQGHRVISFSRERAELRLKGARLSMPFLDPQRLPQPDIQALRSSPAATPQETLQTVSRAAASLTLEAAAQVIEARPAMRGSVVEDTEHVQKMHHVVVAEGRKFMDDLLKRSPTAATEAAREVLIRHTADPAKRRQVEAMTEEQLNEWVKSLFDQANKRLSKYFQAVDAIRY